MPLPELQSLLEGLAETVRADKPSGNELVPDHRGFDFLASSSIRGDSFCRVCAFDKVKLLTRYAALYCDRVLVPCPLEPLAFDTAGAREAVATRILYLLEMRPVLESGIVQLFAPSFYFCAEHMREFKHTTAPIYQRAQELYRRRIDDFEVVYRPKEHGLGPCVEIEGPAEYVEHGKLMTIYRARPNWAPKRLGKVGGAPGKLLSRTTVKKSRVVWRFFDALAVDLIFQQMVGEQQNARYLTDLPGEATFFARSGVDDERAAATAAICARLTHAVPLLRDVPLRTVLKLRRRETDSFELYRRALSEIVETYVKPGKFVSEKVADQIYNDILRPRLLKLKIEADSKRRSARIKAATKLGLPSALISVGLVAGLLPNDIAQLLRMAGIASLMAQAADSLTELKRNATEVRNQDLYFLLRLSQET